MTLQRTIGGVIDVEGVALHCGDQTRVRLLPGELNSGIKFIAGGVSIEANVDRVVDTQLATTIGVSGTTVRTVEHLLSALYGLGIDNLRVDVQGAEVPVLDGCAGEWARRIGEVGVVEQDSPARVMHIKEPVEVRDGDRVARLEPGTGFSVDMTIQFDHPSVGRQRLELDITPESYERELAWARTFGFARLVPAMQRMGLVRGGSLENALVFGDDGPLNEGGVIQPDEPVRHKMLDAVGDIALLGVRLHGHLVTELPGHGLIVALVRAVQAQPDSWDIRSAEA